MTTSSEEECRWRRIIDEHLPKDGQTVIVTKLIIPPLKPGAFIETPTYGLARWVLDGRRTPFWEVLPIYINIDFATHWRPLTAVEGPRP